MPRSSKTQGHGGTCRPEARLRAFKEPVSITAEGVAVPLVAVSGACLGTEVALGAASLPFGTVVVVSQVITLIQV